MNTKFESFLLSLPSFKSQEELVIDCIRNGYVTPEAVTILTGKKESSIRRAFSDLKKHNDIRVAGIRRNQANTRNIEYYELVNKQLNIKL